jgi:hypothetical protein
MFRRLSAKKEREEAEAASAAEEDAATVPVDD